MRTWFVAGKGFAWERPFSKADIKRFGDAAPPEDRSSRFAWRILARRRPCFPCSPGLFFTIPQFDGYSAVLIQLRNVSQAALREAITDGWLMCAPARLMNQYLGR